jgi:nitroreductase
VPDCLLMEFSETVRRRAMVRSFSAEPVDPGVVDTLLDAALRAPTAGNTGGTAWVVLEGPDQTAAYFDTTTDAAWRASHPSWSEGLRRAPVVLLAYASPEAYVSRYAQSDKSTSGLGVGADAWPVPYWHGDAAMGVMTLLLAAVDAGLGTCILGAFRGEDALAARLGVPDGWRLHAAVALGRPDGAGHRSASLGRPGPDRASRIHRRRW